MQLGKAGSDRRGWILGAAMLCSLAHAAPPLEVVARLQEMPGNIAVTPSGRVIVSMHQFAPSRYRVGEIRDGHLLPFPNAALNGADRKDPLTLDTVLGIWADERGCVWMLDNGMRGKTTPRLIAWNTNSDQLSQVLHLPAPVTAPNSFVNDLAIDRKHSFAYIADPAGGANAALIIADLTTGAARRVLEGHGSVAPEQVDLVIEGRAIEVQRADGTKERPRIGVNPIALDRAGEWLYFGPMSGTTLYRIRTAPLRDALLTGAALAAHVERYSDKPLCDGIAIDESGVIYVSEVAGDAVGVIGADRAYRRLFTDKEQLSWPDAFSIQGGFVYVVANQLHRTAFLNSGVDATRPPFQVLRFRAESATAGKE